MVEIRKPIGYGTQTTVSTQPGGTECSDCDPSPEMNVEVAPQDRFSTKAENTASNKDGAGKGVIGGFFSNANKLKAELAEKAKVAQEKWSALQKKTSDLIHPLVDHTGALDFSQFKGKSFEGFREFLLAQAELNDNKSFSSPYADLLAEKKYEPLLELLYQLSNSGHTLDKSLSDLETLLRQFTAELIDIDADALVGRFIGMKCCRDMLLEVIKDDRYSRDTRIDLLEAIRRVGKDYVDRGKIENMSENLSWFNLNGLVSDHDLARATGAAIYIIEAIEKAEGAREVLFKDTANEYARLAAEKKAMPDTVSQLQSSLAEIIVTASNGGFIGQLKGVKDERGAGRIAAEEKLRSYIINEAKRLYQAGETVKTDKDLARYNEELQKFLKGSWNHLFSGSLERVLDSQLELDGGITRKVVFKTRLDDSLNNGLADMVSGISATYRQPFDSLGSTSDMIHHAQSMGEVILDSATSAISEDKELKDASENLAQALTNTRLKLWHGYKQHGALSRGLSNAANVVGGSGNIARIEAANAELKEITGDILYAIDQNELETAIQRLQRGLEEDGVIHKAIDAAEMDGVETSINFLQTTLEIIAIALVTKGAGATLGAGRGAVAGGEAAINAAGRTSKIVQYAKEAGIRSARGFGMGAQISVAENAVSVATDQVGAKADLEKWIKDAIATGLSMAITGLLPASAAKGNIIEKIWQRYTVGGLRAAGRFGVDTGVETLEEAVNQMILQALDGNFDALSFAQLAELVRVCAAGGGLKVGAIAEAIKSDSVAQGFSPATGPKDGVAQGFSPATVEGPTSVIVEPDPKAPEPTLVMPTPPPVVRSAIPEAKFDLADGKTPPTWVMPNVTTPHILTPEHNAGRSAPESIKYLLVPSPNGNHHFILWSPSNGISYEIDRSMQVIKFKIADQTAVDSFLAPKRPDVHEHRQEIVSIREEEGDDGTETHVTLVDKFEEYPVFRELSSPRELAEHGYRVEVELPKSAQEVARRLGDVETIGQDRIRLTIEREADIPVLDVAAEFGQQEIAEGRTRPVAEEDAMAIAEETEPSDGSPVVAPQIEYLHAGFDPRPVLRQGWELLKKGMEWLFPVENITHSMPTPNGKNAHLMNAELVLNMGGGRTKKISVEVETGSQEELQKRADEIAKILSTMPPALLRRVKTIRVFSKNAEAYGYESCSSAYSDSRRAIHIYDGAKIRTLKPDVNWDLHDLRHELAHSIENERGFEGKIKKAIKDGGTKAEEFYSANAFKQEWKKSNSERWATAVTMYLVDPAMLKAGDPRMADLIEEKFGKTQDEAPSPSPAEKPPTRVPGTPVAGSRSGATTADRPDGTKLYTYDSAIEELGLREVIRDVSSWTFNINGERPIVPSVLSAMRVRLEMALKRFNAMEFEEVDPLDFSAKDKTDLRDFLKEKIEQLEKWRSEIENGRPMDKSKSGTPVETKGNNGKHTYESAFDALGLRDDIKQMAIWELDPKKRPSSPDVLEAMQAIFEAALESLKTMEFEEVFDFSARDGADLRILLEADIALLKEWRSEIEDGRSTGKPKSATGPRAEAPDAAPATPDVKAPGVPMPPDGKAPVTTLRDAIRSGQTLDVQYSKGNLPPVKPGFKRVYVGKEDLMDWEDFIIFANLSDSPVHASQYVNASSGDSYLYVFEIPEAIWKNVTHENQNSGNRITSFQGTLEAKGRSVSLVDAYIGRVKAAKAKDFSVKNEAELRDKGRHILLEPATNEEISGFDTALVGIEADLPAPSPISVIVKPDPDALHVIYDAEDKPADRTPEMPPALLPPRSRTPGAPMPGDNGGHYVPRLSEDATRLGPNTSGPSPEAPAESPVARRIDAARLPAGPGGRTAGIGGRGGAVTTVLATFKLGRALDKLLGNHPEKREIKKILLEAYESFGNDDFIKDFVAQYNGPPELLSTTVRNRLNLWKRIVKDGISSEELLEWLPDGEIRELWRRYASQGWKVTFQFSKEWVDYDKNDLFKNALGHVVLAGKTIRIRIAMVEQDPRIVFAHEVEHLRQLELWEVHGIAIEQEIRRLIVNSTSWTPEQLEGDLRRNGVENAGATSVLVYSDLLRKVPDVAVAAVLGFLMERDASAKELEAYRALSNLYHGMRTKLFDEIAANPIRAKRVFTKHNQDRFLLSDLSVGIFYDLSLDILLARTQGPTLTDLDRVNAQTDPAFFPWETEEDVKTAVPSALHDLSSSWNHDLAENKFFARMGEEEVEGLAAFLVSPLALDCEGAYKFVSKNLPRLAYEYTRFHRYVGDAIRMIGRWNERHGEARGFEEILGYLHRYRLDPSKGRDDGNFFYILETLRKTTHPEKLKKLVDALLNAPVFYGIKRDANNVGSFVGFLKDISKDPSMVPPDPARLDVLLTEWYDHWTTTATATDDYNRPIHMMWAMNLAKGAANYYRFLAERNGAVDMKLGRYMARWKNLYEQAKAFEGRNKFNVEDSLWEKGWGPKPGTNNVDAGKPAKIESPAEAPISVIVKPDPKGNPKGAYAIPDDGEAVTFGRASKGSRQPTHAIEEMDADGNIIPAGEKGSVLSREQVKVYYDEKENDWAIENTGRHSTTSVSVIDESTEKEISQPLTSGEGSNSLVFVEPGRYKIIVQAEDQDIIPNGTALFTDRGAVLRDAIKPFKYPVAEFVIEVPERKNPEMAHGGDGSGQGVVARPYIPRKSEGSAAEGGGFLGGDFGAGLRARQQAAEAKIGRAGGREFNVGAPGKAGKDNISIIEKVLDSGDYTVISKAAKKAFETRDDLQLPPELAFRLGQKAPNVDVLLNALIRLPVERAKILFSEASSDFELLPTIMAGGIDRRVRGVVDEIDKILNASSITEDGRKEIEHHYGFIMEAMRCADNIGVRVSPRVIAVVQDAANKITALERRPLVSAQPAAALPRPKIGRRALSKPRGDAVAHRLEEMVLGKRKPPKKLDRSYAAKPQEIMGRLVVLTGHHEPSEQVTTKDIETFAGMTANYWYNMLVEKSSSAEITKEAEDRYKETVKQLGGKYKEGWFHFSGKDRGRKDRGRIYFSVDPARAEEFVKDLKSEVLNPLGHGFDDFKIAGALAGINGLSERADGAVLYFYATHEKAVIDRVIEFIRRHPEYTEEGYHPFAAQLADNEGRLLAGVTFGENPTTHHSLNNVYSDVLYNAFHDAKEQIESGRKLKWRDIARYIDIYFRKFGVDPKQPAFYGDGTNRFPYALQHVFSTQSEVSHPEPAAIAVPNHGAIGGPYIPRRGEGSDAENGGFLGEASPFGNVAAKRPQIGGTRGGEFNVGVSNGATPRIAVTGKSGLDGLEIVGAEAVVKSPSGIGDVEKHVQIGGATLIFKLTKDGCTLQVRSGEVFIQPGDNTKEVTIVEAGKEKPLEFRYEEWTLADGDILYIGNTKFEFAALAKAPSQLTIAINGGEPVAIKPETKRIVIGQDPAAEKDFPGKPLSAHVKIRAGDTRQCTIERSPDGRWRVIQKSEIYPTNVTLPDGKRVTIETVPEYSGHEGRVRLLPKLVELHAGKNVIEIEGRKITINIPEGERPLNAAPVATQPESPPSEAPTKVIPLIDSSSGSLKIPPKAEKISSVTVSHGLAYGSDGETTSLVGKIDGLTPELERKFASGSRVEKVDWLEPGKIIYMIDEHAKGGVGNTRAARYVYPSNPKYATAEKQYKIFTEWHAKASFAQISPEEARRNFSALTGFLEQRGIEFDDGEASSKDNFDPFLGSQYQEALNLLKLCPDTLLRSNALKRIVFNAGRAGGGRIGGFENGEARMVPESLKISRKMFQHFFLHEIGHAIYEGLSPSDRAHLQSLLTTILKTHVPIAVDTAIQSVAERIGYISEPDEFLAETNTLYIMAGDFLRDRISRFKGPARKAYEEIYDFYRNLHGGREFTSRP